jgi:hypothetical protein
LQIQKRRPKDCRSLKKSPPPSPRDEYICLTKYFHKSIHMLAFNKYFDKNKKSKLYFEDRVIVQIDLLHGYMDGTPCMEDSSNPEPKGKR